MVMTDGRKTTHRGVRAYSATRSRGLWRGLESQEAPGVHGVGAEIRAHVDGSGSVEQRLAGVVKEIRLPTARCMEPGSATASVLVMELAMAHSWTS